MSHEVDLKSTKTSPAAERWLGVASEQAIEPLRQGAERRPSKAGPVPIHRGMTVAEGFAAIVSACVRHFERNEPLLIEARSAEALHQVRVAMRRLRCALSLFKPAIRDEQAAHFERELRAFSGQLGEARDLDVCLELGTGDRLAIEEKREVAYDNAILTMKSHRFRQLMLELVSWAATGEWWETRKARRALRPFVDRRIDRLWSKVSAARRLRRASDEDRHRLRIRTKKLRYALEFVAALHARERKRRKSFGKAVRRLQGELGLLNDIAFARSLGADDSAIDELAHVQGSRRALRRMRDVGPYWRG